MKMATNCFILSNQKLWYGTQFLHKNKVKWRILQAGSLKQSIKKDMFSIVSKININLFGSGREEYSPPSSQLITPLYTCHKRRVL